jgi:NADP-dependent 3-hydroxy acid dehydrogenase YdfG
MTWMYTLQPGWVVAHYFQILINNAGTLSTEMLAESNVDTWWQGWIDNIKVTSLHQVSEILGNLSSCAALP